MDLNVDVAIVGAGTAGMPCAIESVRAGARVAVIEQADRIGGALHVSAAQMSGAGAKRQQSRGIVDDWRTHLDDVLRISRGTCQAELVELATKLGASTIDWLEAAGFEFDPSTPAILHFHEAYRTARTFWGVNGGRSVLKVVMPLFEAAMAQPNATLLLKTEMAALRQEKSGVVTGIVVRGADGVERTIEARHVVLATGGYGGDKARFARWTGGRALHTAALPTATGAGIEMGVAAGGVLRGGEHYLPTFAGIPAQSGGHQILWDQLPSLTPQVRAPWEVFVGSDGRRFVREDIDSVDARERALNARPDALFWAVFDERIWREAPPMLPGWKADELAAAWASHENFVTAATLDELATRIGCDAATLNATIAAYNDALRAGKPDPMGRESRPVPVEAAPFRAIRMHGMVLKTPTGLTVDRELRVVKADGSPIPGLYAIGEALGGATLSGNAFVGGMSVTPALGFGRWLGAKLAGRDLLEVV
jgi:fumarate reductase flavoprotein subunit